MNVTYDLDLNLKSFENDCVQTEISIFGIYPFDISRHEMDKI